MKEGESIHTQIRAIEEHAKAKNLNLVNIYRDEGKSGKDIVNRPEMVQLLESARRGEFDVLIINRVSRLGRNTLDLIRVAAELEKLKIDASKTNKDGKLRRRYACYWSITSGKQLALHQRHRCPLPLIHADELEEQVLHQIVTRFTFRGRLRTENGVEIIEPQVMSIFQPEHHAHRVAELQEAKEKLAHEISIKSRARQRAYQLLERDDYDPDELALKLRDFRDEITMLEARVREVEASLDALNAEMENDATLHNFLRDNKEALAQLRRAILDLPADDKKLLVESVLKDKIRVALDTESPGHWGASGFGLAFNHQILGRIPPAPRVRGISSHTQNARRSSMLDRLVDSGGAGGLVPPLIFCAYAR